MVNTQIILVSVSFIVMLVLLVLAIKLLYYGKDESKPTGEYYTAIPPNIIPNKGFNIKNLYKDEYNSQQLLNIIVNASQNLQTKTEELKSEIKDFNLFFIYLYQ